MSMAVQPSREPSGRALLSYASNDVRVETKKHGGNKRSMKTPTPADMAAPNDVVVRFARPAGDSQTTLEAGRPCGWATVETQSNCDMARFQGPSYLFAIVIDARVRTRSG